MKRTFAGVACLCMFMLGGCSDPAPHELDDVEQRAWARQAIEEHYEYERELVVLVDTGIESSANYCAAAMVHLEESGSLDDFWEEEFIEDLAVLIRRDDLLSMLHVGYGVGCPDIFEEFVTWQGF